MTDSTTKLYLAINTSTTHGAIALITANAHDVHTIAQRDFHTARSHNSALFVPLNELLESSENQQIEAIVVGTGPGSYTGVRIGIAAANGLAVARKTRVIGIPSVLGLCPEHDNFLAVGDARRGNGYHWKVANGIPQGNAKITSNNELLHIIAESTHPVATLETLATELGTQPQQIDLKLLVTRYISAPHVFDTNTSVEPIYLAAPFVTSPKQH